MRLDADIVCARAKNHFDPAGSLEIDTAGSPGTGARSPPIEAYKRAFVPINQRIMDTMVRSAHPLNHFHSLTILRL